MLYQLSYEATDVGNRSIVGSYVPVKEMSVNDMWNKSYMNCGNEMKMKKWSSQWTQFMQLRKEAWKKNSRLNFFFQAYLHSCINCVHCDDHFFIFISFPQFIYDLFHISLSLKISLVNIWICHIYVFFGLKLHETADFVSDLGAYNSKKKHYQVAFLW